MVDWLQAMCLALIQGLTEFLPISSSAHLILPSQLLGWPDQGLLFDVGVHTGTLMAVVLFYRSSLVAIARALVDGDHEGRQELMALMVATLPVLMAGYLLQSWLEAHLRGIEVIAIATLLFGVLLGIAAYHSKRTPRLREQIGLTDALLIGLAQVLALIPGTSRSGITITAGLFLGYHPAAATRFSFLMSVPVIGGALLLMVLPGVGELPEEGWSQYLAAALVAGICAYATIGWFVRLLERVGLMPFVLYRVALGIALLLLLGKG